MKRHSRRTFLKTTAVTGAALTLPPAHTVLGANDTLNVAVVGIKSQGRNHINWMRGLPGVRVVAVCDPDQAFLDRETLAFEKRGEKVQTYTDVRKLLENKDIDVVSTATPDHWHCLVTIWACQAGKDVYVEKPLSHCLWEGRQAVEAAHKHNRIVQWGNQSHGKIPQDLHLEVEGKGKILAAYAAKYRRRESIGKVDGPQAPPATLDYDLWCGPAPKDPLMRENLHYDWHWVWPTGTGEIGNNGIYPLDAVRVALGQNTLPKRVMSFGGRYKFNDDGTTPNTQVALLQYDPGPMVILEVRNLHPNAGPKVRGSRLVCEQGEAGYPSQPSHPGETGDYKDSHQRHMHNFITAVRSRKESDLRAPLIQGHLSSAMVHLANISYRLGEAMSFDAAREVLQDRGSEARDTFDRTKGHLEASEIDTRTAEITVGPWLEFDPETEQFTGAGEIVKRANELTKREYRAPFVVPEKV